MKLPKYPNNVPFSVREIRLVRDHCSGSYAKPSSLSRNLRERNRLRGGTNFHRSHTFENFP
jgi:hypothetical protein